MRANTTVGAGAGDDVHAPAPSLDFGRQRDHDRDRQRPVDRALATSPTSHGWRAHGAASLKDVVCPRSAITALTFASPLLAKRFVMNLTKLGFDRIAA